MHEIIENGKLKEVYKATGGAWGGSKVSALFENYLKEMFGSSLIEKVKKEYPADWVATLREFEQLKRAFSTNMAENVAVLMIKPCFNEIYQEMHGETLVAAFERNKISNRRGATLRRRTRLQIPSIVLMNMIETVSVDIKLHVEELIANLDCDLSFVIMVGGFSNSPVLKEEVKSAVKNVPVIIPEDAELSVVKGAVFFGWNPEAILVRKSKFSYGIQTCKDFEEGTDSTDRKVIDDDGKFQCDNVFDTLVKEMQEVEIGATIRKTYFPSVHNARTIALPVYYSAKREVKYTDENGCIFLGVLSVPMPDLTGDKARQVKVLVKFGGTEFQVDAEDITSGKKVNASFDFLCS